MPNTYSQIYIQIVFAVKGRGNLVSSTHREELHKYITGIVQNRGQKNACCIFNARSYTCFDRKPNISISDLVRDIKAGSSKFINDSHWVKGKFNWQEGYGAFSYSKSQIDNVIRYILNQEEHHHRGKTFREEYLKLLNDFEIEFDTRYLFEWIE